MIQATVAHTRPSGFFSTLKSILFSRGPAEAPRVRRGINDGERALLLAVSQRVDSLLDGGHEAYDDAGLIIYIDRHVMEPLRELLREVAAEWAEPHLGRLSNLLCDASGGLASFYEHLIDRDDYLVCSMGLDELENDLRVLARS